MPVWRVQVAGNEDETVTAELVATDSGSLVALSAEGLLLRAWAPGQWRTVRHVGNECVDPVDRATGGDRVLIGFPRG